MMPSRRKKLTVGLAAFLLAVGLVVPLAAQQERWEKLNDEAKSLKGQGKYAEALLVAQEALRVAEARFGLEHPNVAKSLNNLAEVYRAQGKYAEAEPLCKRALAIDDKALRPNHPDVVTSLNNLAWLYQAQDKYFSAEPLYKRALAIREKALGPEHLDVATSLNNLALLYQAEGKYAAAEPLLKRALAIEEKALGTDDPDVAKSLNSLAELCRAQGRYAAAEPLYKLALAIREKALRPDDPDVATSLNNLALLHQAQSRYAAAEPLYKRALAIREKALGPNHPDLATSLNNLAGLYRAWGKYAGAEPLYRRAQAIQEKALGPDHPDVATSLANYAELLRHTDRVAEAKQMEARAQAIRARHAQENPHTLNEGTTRATPFPIEAQGRGKCRLTVNPLSTKHDIFQVKGEGFMPSEVLKIAFNSDSEGGEITTKASGDGTFSWVVAPAVVGKGGGTASFSAADTSCSVTVTYPWGDAIALPAGPLAQAAPEAQATPAAPVVLSVQNARPSEADLAIRLQKADPVAVAARAVTLDDDIGLLKALRDRHASNVTMYLGTEKVTPANAEEVLGRLERERQIVSEEIDRRGFGTIAGDYDVHRATPSACDLSLWFKDYQPSDPLGPVTVVQNGHAVELKGRGPLVGQGVMVG